MVKALIALLAFVVIGTLAAIRKAKGRRSVELLEAGQICVYCQSTKLSRGQNGLLCNSCGQTTPWTLIEQPSLSSEEIDTVNTPDASNPFHR